MEAVRERKEALRSHFRRIRSQMSRERYSRQSAAIVQKLEKLPEVTGADTVHLYWPVVEKREVDVRPLIGQLHRAGKRIALPVVDLSAAGAGTPHMEHRRYEGPATLRTNAWGLSEPNGTEAVPPEEIDVVIVPAFGVGRNGHRIGHGHGFYDAFLADLQAITICPIYSQCLVDEIPAEPHDVPLQILVTEEEVLRPDV